MPYVPKLIYQALLRSALLIVKESNAGDDLTCKHCGVVGYGHAPKCPCLRAVDMQIMFLPDREIAEATAERILAEE